MASDASLIHSTITDERHDPIVRFVASVLLSLSLSSVVLRLAWIRHPLKALFGIDDLATIFCAVMTSIQTACLLLSLQYGFAQKEANREDEAGRTAQKIIFAGDVLYVFALSLSRLASSLFCRRVTGTATREQTIFSVLSIVITGWGVVGMLVVAIQPPYSQPWASVDRDPNSNFVRWAVVESIGMLFDALLSCFVSTLIWRLQMPFDKKIAVTIAFSSRLPVIAFAAIRLQSLHRAQDLTNFNFQYAQPQIWAQIELHYSLMATTIPSLHIVLKNLTTGWLADLKDHPETSMASKSIGNRYGGLSLVQSNKMTNRSQEQGSIVELQDWTNRKAETRAFAHKEVKGDDAASDGSERRILVHRTVDISHGTDDR